MSKNAKPSSARNVKSSEAGELETALRREIQRRRRMDKVVAKQWQALSTTLGLVLSQPTRAEFLPALLRAIVRECGGLWATMWQVTDDGAGGLREAASYRDAELGAAVEEFVDAHPSSVRRLARLHMKLCRENHATVVLAATDLRTTPEVRAFNKKVGVVSMVLSPMLRKGQLIGWICFLCAEPRSRIEPGCVAFIETATSQATLFQHLTELAERNKELERRRTITAERERLGRDLHDLIAQFFSGILLQMEALRAEAPVLPEKLQNRLGKIRHLATQGVHELRRTLSTTARPTVLDEHTLPMALEILAAETTAASGVTVTFQSGPETLVLDSKVEVHLYAIASEAIQNAIHHAKPSRVELRLAHQAGALRLEIHDDGGGFSAGQADRRESPYFGLENMRQRARAAGGTLAIESARGRGTTITVELPPPR